VPGGGDQTVNLYETLGVPKDADEDTIKKAYRKASSKAHPDREGGSAEKMQQVNDAYAVLSVPERRKEYDETGSAQEKSPVEQEAAGFVMEAMAAVLDTPAGDVVTNATVMLQGKYAQHRRNMEKVDEIEKKFLALKAKVQVKDGKPNLAHRVIEQRLEPLPRVRAEGARISAAYELAFEMLRAHDAENTNPPEPSGTVFWHGGNFTAG